jgi:hypothetical protein
MKKVLLLLVMLLVMILSLQVYDLAAYEIHLKNGSVISGVLSYDDEGDEVSLYFGTGSMTIQKKDIRKIEGAELRESGAKERQETQPEPEQKQVLPREAPSPAASEDNKSARADELKTSLRSVDAEIKTAEEEEARLTGTINEKTVSSAGYDLDQQTESELSALKRNLNSIQKKKADLVNRKASIENELRSLGQ